MLFSSVSYILTLVQVVFWDSRGLKIVLISNAFIFRPGFFTQICLFKFNIKNIRKRCEICSRLTIKTPKRRHWPRSGVFIVNFEHMSNLFPNVSIVDFEQVNVSWAVFQIVFWCSFWCTFCLSKTDGVIKKIGHAVASEVWIFLFSLW